MQGFPLMSVWEIRKCPTLAWQRIISLMTNRSTPFLNSQQDSCSSSWFWMTTVMLHYVMFISCPTKYINTQVTQFLLPKTQWRPAICCMKHKRGWNVYFTSHTLTQDTKLCTYNTVTAEDILYYCGLWREFQESISYKPHVVTIFVS